jgi:hypothetical protein
MYALTVRQPWAHAIIAFGKDVENRTWTTEYRGPLAIHAGKTFDYEGGRVLEKRGYDLLVGMPGGVIVGVVDLVGVVDNSRSRWAARGQYHWLLSNPRPLDRPIQCRGQQGLWVPDARLMSERERRILERT